MSDSLLLPVSDADIIAAGRRRRACHLCIRPAAAARVRFVAFARAPRLPSLTRGEGMTDAIDAVPNGSAEDLGTARGPARNSGRRVLPGRAPEKGTLMRTLRATLVLTAALTAASCAATKAGNAEDIRFSGFLSSYAGLRATNDSDRAAFFWAKPGLDLTHYGRILLDKPEARMSPDALKSMGDEDLSYLLGDVDKTLREALSARWMMADAPGPNVLRIRVCLTDADSTTAALTPFNRILPVGVLVSKGVQLATGTGLNVGKVTGEMEMLDGESGERLMAAVDRRVGTGVARETFSTWGDVDQVFQLWAERIVARLPEYGMPSKSFR
jgi:hypothetical protein